MIVYINFFEILLLVLLLLLLVLYGAFMISNHLRQSVCKHEKGIYETRACAAICRSCNKNLGFIGTEENKIRRRQ